MLSIYLALSTCINNRRMDKFQNVGFHNLNFLSFIISVKKSSTAIRVGHIAKMGQLKISCNIIV
jgi:hypothetical protein